MDKELFEIKDKILNFCNKYKVKNMTVHLQKDEVDICGDYNKAIIRDVDLEIEV